LAVEVTVGVDTFPGGGLRRPPSSTFDASVDDAVLFFS